MDRGSRLINLFQTLEKVTPGRHSQRLVQEELQQLRYATTKILQYVQGQEKVHRDLILRDSHYLDQLLATLTYCGDTCVETNIVYTIHELIGKSHTGKRVSTLVSHGATHVLLQTLVYEAHDQGNADDLLVLIHQVLAKLGPKDRKFGVKARLSQALPVTLNLIRNYISNTKLLQPVLHVLKLYAANAVNASYLGKNGAVTYLFKILSLAGRKHLTLLKYALDTLGLLVKSKSNSARAIGQGGVPALLNMFYDWHRVDTKNRHISLRKSILIVLKHLTNLKSGRKALIGADGIRILYATCQESVDCRELESVIFMASLVMRKCFPKNRLPLNHLRSPLTCPLPESDFHFPDTGEGQDIVDVSVTNVLDQLQTGDDNGYESSIDNDDDISSDDEIESNKIESEEDGDGELKNDLSNQRTWEELAQYKGFFPELYEYDTLLEDEPFLQDPPIIIPTAAYNPLDNQSSNWGVPEARLTQSVAQYQEPCQKMPNRHSLPNLNAATSPGGEEYLTASISDLKLSADVNECDSILEGAQRASSSTRFHSRLKGYFAENGENILERVPSAVNMKTGCSIFSLDLSPSTSDMRASQTKSGKRRGAKQCKGSAVARDRRSKAKAKSETVFATDVLEITPIRTHSDHTLGPDNMEEDENSPEGEEPPQPPIDGPEIFMAIASRTRSVGRFNKVAYPEMWGQTPPPFKEPLHEKKFGVQRSKIFEDIDRFINPDHVIDQVVYDLDAIVNMAGPTYTACYSNLTNRDQIRVSRKEDLSDHLKFNGQFESGNLRKVIQVRKYEYDLILSPDVNTNHHHQWFYFEVSNMEAGVKYRFNIVNCEKLNSQFNFGMKPVMYSVTEAMNGRPHWLRVGSEICYYKNHFTRSSQTTGGVRGKSYFTATFNINFKHDNDVCYLAYHYPYTYSTLQAHLYKWQRTYDSRQIYFRNQTLCQSLLGNAIPVLTITSHPHTYDREGIEQLKSRPYIFLSCRVHPGESNSSWVMRGTINFLLSDRPAAQNLRDTYIFKIVPMLNPDGVINGNHRCSVVAEDLNRRWLQPCPKLHPTIYHTKGLLHYLQHVDKAPLVFCDYHGHSRRKNVFMYGCSPSLSWMQEDLNNPTISGTNKLEDTGYKTLPRILHNVAPAFSLNNCSFMVEKTKETTARVVVWRQIGIIRSYTMESTYCGCDQGPYRGQQISPRELEEMGRKFCEGLAKVRSRHMRSFSTISNMDGTMDMQISGGELGACGRMDTFSAYEGATCAEAMGTIEPINLPSNSESGSCTESEQSEIEEEMEELDAEFS